MKKLDLGQTLQLLGNAGIIVGILLLVYELNQNREMMAAQTRNEIAQNTASMIQGEALSSEMVGISVKASAGESLTPVEQEQFDLLWFGYIRLWENAHYQYRNGLFDDDEYLAVRRSWVRLLSEDPRRRLWCLIRDELSQDFAADIESALPDACDAK